MTRIETADFHGLAALRLRATDDASVLVTLQGAQVVSWIPASGAEQFFVSELNSFAPGHPIRGGVPVVFPQFSKRGPLPQHGFARNKPWRLEDHRVDADGAHATFALESSDDTMRLWPHPFVARLNVTVAGAHLDIELIVKNTGQDPLAFTTALHTYFGISDARNAYLAGLSGLRFEEEGRDGTDMKDRVTAEGPVDRIYFHAPDKTRLVDGARTLLVSQRGFRDTVVWNPGRERTAAMADMVPDAYLRMFCVEAAVVQSPIELRSGETWTGAQHLEVT